MPQLKNKSKTDESKRPEIYVRPGAQHTYVSHGEVVPIETGKNNTNARTHRQIKSDFKGALQPYLTSSDMQNTVQAIILLRDAAHGTYNTQGRETLAPQKVEEMLKAVAKMTGQRQNRKNDAPLNQKEIQAYHEAVLEIAQDMQSDMVMNEELGNNFEANWNLGRLFHNLGKPLDALPYISAAQKIQPDNPKVAARLTEVAFDLNNESPSTTNEIRVLSALTHTVSLEASYPVAVLQRRAQKTFDL